MQQRTFVCECVKDIVQAPYDVCDKISVHTVAYMSYHADQSNNLEYVRRQYRMVPDRNFRWVYQIATASFVLCEVLYKTLSYMNSTTIRF